MTITTLNDIPIEFPVSNPDARPANFTETENRMTDVRSELDRMQRQIEQLTERKDSLSKAQEGSDPEAGDPMVDTPQTP